MFYKLIVSLFLLTISISFIFGAPILYARVTSFGKSGYRTIDNCAAVDLNTGAMTLLTQNYIFLEASITIDGISTFDSTNNVFYYVTDATSDLNIYSANVVAKTLQAPIDIYSYSIGNLAFDNTMGRLLVSAFNNKFVPYFVVYGINEGPVQLFETTPVQLGTGVYEASSQTFYNFWSYRGGSSQVYMLTKIGISNPNFPTYTNVTVGCNYYPSKLFLDAAVPTTLYGVVEVFSEAKSNSNSSATLTYFIYNINKTTGACTNIVQLPSLGGIVTSYTFGDGVLYYGEATNGGNFLHIYTVATKQHRQVPTMFVLEDIQVKVNA